MSHTSKEKLRFLPIQVTFPPIPSTTTLLALGFLLGNLMFTPMIALLGTKVPPEYRDAVGDVVTLFKDGMLIILGFYFAKAVNTVQTDMANKALDVAASSTPKEDKGEYHN